MSTPKAEREPTFKCGYDARCPNQNRVPKKDMLCPDCLESELIESTNEMETY